MKFPEFIENRFQELNLAIQLEKDKFDVFKEAEIKAAHHILTSYREILKWGFMPKVVYNFIEMKLGFRDEPKPVIINRIKEQNEKKTE